MFRWIKMYWLFLTRNKDRTDYIKKYRSAIEFAPILWLQIYCIPSIIFKFKYTMLICWLLVLNIIICNVTVLKNDKIIKQNKINKERKESEYKAKTLLGMVINLMQKLNYPTATINNYYRQYVIRINSASKFYAEWSSSEFDFIIIELQLMINKLNSDCKYKKEYNNTYRQNHYNSSSQISNKEKFLKVLKLPNNITDISIIRKQYIKLIKQYHPDVIHDNGEKAKEINIAYQGLKEIFS